MNSNIPLPPRLTILWNQSYLEEGYEKHDIPDPHAEPVISLFPRSFIEKVQNGGFEKEFDYNFRGAVFIDEVTQKNRKWVIDFAKNYFSSKSYFQITDRMVKKRKMFFYPRHRVLSNFDYTFKKEGFVPKERPAKERGFFDKDYFEVLSRSCFTLCPAGDAPWSMRFYEAILSMSLPIVEKQQHTGRNRLEYEINYRYYLFDDPKIEYRPDWAEENYIKFLKHQSLKNNLKSCQLNSLAP